MKKSKLTLLLLAVILSVGCSDIESEGAGPDYKPYMISAGEEMVNLLDTRNELQDQLGKKFSTKVSEDTSSVIVLASYHDNKFDGFNYSDFRPVFDVENKNRKKFALYNGITVSTEKEGVEERLADCMKFEGEYTDYIEVFINGKEIDYSMVDTSDFADVENVVSRYSQAARTFCVQQLKNEGNGNYVVINVSCYADRDNDISVSVFKK